MVCCGTIVAMLLETGMVKALGVTLHDLQKEFATYTWVIGLVISMVPGLGAISCELCLFICLLGVCIHV